MNNYNDKEIEVMSDDELGQFLSILARMLAHDKKAQTKYKIEFDQAKSYRDELSAAYDKYWMLPLMTMANIFINMRK